MPIDSSLCKPLRLLLAKLHGRELHCPINYYECFVLLKRVENLALDLILILRSENMRFPFEDFRCSICCFILKVICLIFTQLGRRLRVVPLSLIPSCMTRKKIVRKKWPREILGARSTRKEGLPPKPKSLNYALLSQRKNMIGLC